MSILSVESIELSTNNLRIHNPADVMSAWMLDEEFTFLLESALLEKDIHN